jgi:hypothetical protein
MKRTLIAVSAAAAAALTATPIDAGPRVAINIGYDFGPNYTYTDFAALPPVIVTRYHLHRNLRYVSQNGVIYVVNPNTYRVVRVIRVG